MSLGEALRAICGTGNVDRRGEVWVAAPAEAAGAAACLAAGRGAGEAVELDLRRLDRFVVRPDTHLVDVGAGLPVATIEARLAAAGFTLGWQALPERPLGAVLAEGEPGPGGRKALPGWSPVAGLEAALPDGRVWRSAVAPRSATGPDLKVLLVGGRGRFGAVTGAVLRVHAAPALSRRVVFAFAGHEATVAAVVEALGRDLFPDRLGLLDGGAGECRVTWESTGEPRTVALLVSLVEEAWVSAGGRRLAVEARAGAPRPGAWSEGAAGPDEVRAALPDPGHAGPVFVCRWSQVAAARRALLQGVGGGARVHLLRALPEGPLALAQVPEAHAERARELLRTAGALCDGDAPEAGWYEELGAAFEASRRGGGP